MKQKDLLTVDKNERVDLAPSLASRSCALPIFLGKNSARLQGALTYPHQQSQIKRSESLILNSTTINNANPPLIEAIFCSFNFRKFSHYSIVHPLMSCILPLI